MLNALLSNRDVGHARQRMYHFQDSARQEEASRQPVDMEKVAVAMAQAFPGTVISRSDN